MFISVWISLIFTSSQLVTGSPGTLVREEEREKYPVCLHHGSDAVVYACSMFLCVSDENLLSRITSTAATSTACFYSRDTVRRSQRFVPKPQRPPPHSTKWQQRRVCVADFSNLRAHVNGNILEKSLGSRACKSEALSTTCPHVMSSTFHCSPQMWCRVPIVLDRPPLRSNRNLHLHGDDHEGF